jgi:hypothetical protein
MDSYFAERGERIDTTRLGRQDIQRNKHGKLRTGELDKKTVVFPASVRRGVCLGLYHVRMLSRCPL